MRLFGLDKIFGSAALLNFVLTHGMCKFLIFRLRIRYDVQIRPAALAVVSDEQRPKRTLAEQNHPSRLNNRCRCALFEVDGSEVV